MRKRYPFDYAVVRVVPRVDRGEFLNAGVIVFSSTAAFREIVARVRRTPAQVVFRFARQIGILPLTGTTDPVHMREDLAIDDFELSAEDVERMVHDLRR